MTTENLGLDELIANQSEPHVPVNKTVRRLDSLVMCRVIDKDLNAPPGGTPTGARYIVGPSPSGAWAGHAGEIAYYSGGWLFVPGLPGFKVFVIDEGIDYEFSDENSPDGWVPYGRLVTFQVPCSDMTTNITTGNRKSYLRAPFAFVLEEVRASLLTTSSSGIPTVDVNRNGSTILSTKITVDAGELTSLTAATPPAISGGSVAIADDDEFSFDIDVAGTGARGMIVTLIGTRL